MKILTLALAASCASQEPDAPASAAPANPVELGRVAWGRDLEAGFQEARASGRPVFLLFQEIPGCQTCRDFGQGPLSHPLLVEGLETAFVPVAVYNNRPGRDADVLERYGEPSWNNPVFRFFAPDGEELLPRRDGLWSTRDVAPRLVDALEAAGRDVPPYLGLAALEARPRARATFAMHCFWQGEAALGALDGVVATRVGWLDGREVVEVEYVEHVLPLERLLQSALAFDCADRVHVTTDAQLAVARAAVGERARRSGQRAGDAQASDRKYHLRRSRLAPLPLTPAQAARVNAALAGGGDPLAWLAPGQRELARRLAALEDRSALDGLQPPEDGDPAALARYEAVLRARL